MHMEDFYFNTAEPRSFLWQELLSNRPQDTETPASQHEAPSESDRTPTSTTPSTKPSGFESQPPPERGERGSESPRPTDQLSMHHRSISSIEKRKAKKAAYRKAKQEEEEGKE